MFKKLCVIGAALISTVVSAKDFNLTTTLKVGEERFGPETVVIADGDSQTVALTKDHQRFVKYKVKKTDTGKVKVDGWLILKKDGNEFFMNLPQFELTFGEVSEQEGSRFNGDQVSWKVKVTPFL
ncbi:hypothetical protein [Algicola sagamiensis]|uniref:hypothetical protein n=1 Tax=Algicola sagamiensis TaxID=163869 RepID=UPI0003A1DE6D|nr:hypothetical protein [Algicola sagamiensis]